MFTKDKLLEQLSVMGIDKTGTLKIHFSYKAMGEIEGGPNTVIEVLTEYMKDGLLVIPTHTWRDVKKENPIFDVFHSPSCIGLLTELFRKHPQAVRSLHPTHSVIAIGADAQNFVKNEESLQTPCGQNGVYHKLWQKNAQILLVGVNFSRNTFIHGIEEWDGAKDTISKTREDYYTINHEGHRIHTPQYRHCARIGSDTFTKIEPLAYEKKLLKFSKFGNATTRLMQAKPIRELVAQHLNEDAYYLNDY